MSEITLFKSLQDRGLLVEVVDMTIVKTDQSAAATCYNEIKLKEKLAAKIAVERMFGNEVEIKHAADGHPFIDGIDGSLTISHARNVLVAVYSPDKVVGVDIEYPRNALSRVVSKFLNEDEMMYATNIDNLLKAWTIKEAVYKAMLRKGLSLFAIKLPALDEKKPRAVVETSEGQVEFKLYYDCIGEAMVTLAIRDDAECRGKVIS
ncbi:MAG: 4'-phosphopantetheinyl transferase superfamily protein [Muribaculaceae bacterium]|nr:4'-phosphopantetheinyl transferase superfamily protein [Muribaculaceae bacterium]